MGNKSKNQIKNVNPPEKQVDRFMIFMLLFMFLPAMIFIGIKPYLYENFKTNNLKNDILQTSEETTINKTIPNKDDYVGLWWDLYSQRASMDIKQRDDYLKITALWGDSAIEWNTWSFDCKYEKNDGSLTCIDGVLVNTKVVCNGKEMSDPTMYDECQKKYPETADVNQKYLYTSMKAKLNIKYDNLLPAINDYRSNYSKSENEEFSKNYQNMTLHFNNKFYNDSLNKCVFVKYKKGEE